MSLLTRIRTNAFLKRIAQDMEKRLKRRFSGLLWKLLGPPIVTDVDNLGDIYKVLLIRPNFRIGNALISTPLIKVFRDRFPSAQLHFLAADTTLDLFFNQPIERFFALSRKAILRPWQLNVLLRGLRGEKYDLVVQIGSESLTGCLFARLIGARHSMGMRRNGQRWFDIEVNGTRGHAYNTPLPFARALGVSCRDRPLFIPTQGERQKALILLQQHSITVGAVDSEPFVAVFVGGHLDKRCSVDFWLGLLRKLDSRKIQYIVFLGPEEISLGQELKRRQLSTSSHGALCYPRPLREFAAMLQRACLLVTSDSGAMHLAAAVDVPTITIMQTKQSFKYAPRGSLDTTLWRPSAEQTILTIEETRGKAECPVHPDGSPGQQNQQSESSRHPPLGALGIASERQG